MTKKEQIRENKRRSIFEGEKFRFDYYYLHKDFADLIISNPNDEDKINDFFEKKFTGSRIKKIEYKKFKELIFEDLHNLDFVISSLIEDKQKKINKKDSKILSVIYATLLHYNFIPESEMTRNIGIEIKNSDENNTCRPKLKKGTKIEDIINMILIVIHEFLQSVEAVLRNMSNTEEEYDVLLILLYTSLIITFRTKENHLTGKADKKKVYYSELVDENGNFIPRNIDEYEDEEEAIEEQKEETEESKESTMKGKLNFSFMNKKNEKKNIDENNLEVDLSNLSTTNSRKEVVSEFESKDNDSEQLPNLERI